MAKNKKQPKLKDLINESFENFGGIATLKPVNSPFRNRATQTPNIKESISSQAYQRMSNLTNRKDLVLLTDAIKNISSDLYADGFEKEDVSEFLHKVMTHLAQKYL